MATETWPLTLPQFVMEDGFQFSLSSSSISTTMSTGYDKRRKRFTGQYATYETSFICTLEQITIFEQFFYNNLGYGTELFDFPDPLFIDTTIEVRVKAGVGEVPYTVNPYSDSDKAILTMTLERLISSYTTVPITDWPSTLPDCPLQDGYSMEAQSGLIRDTSTASGKIDVRRRFTATIRKHNMSMIMDRTQLETFINFYASLGHGSLAFNAPYPEDTAQTIKARFDSSSGSGYSIEYFNGVDTFLVSFTWEELPLIKDFT